jgi:toxin-antitoxin system PIN domain toxin
MSSDKPLMLDINILLYAHLSDSKHHSFYASWLREALDKESSFAIPQSVVYGFYRLCTSAKVCKPPYTLEQAREFMDVFQKGKAFHIVSPGPNHWAIFNKLCDQARATGALITDAYHAAHAIEHHCTWVSADSDFKLFPELDWIHLKEAR